MVHDFSGFLPYLHLSDTFVLPTYFVIISLTFCFGIYWFVKRAERRHLRRNDALDIALVLMGAGFIGSRFVHVVFEEPKYYLEAPMRIFHIWQGGFVWYGGAIFGAIATILFVRFKKLALWPWLETFAPVGALGYALGRAACLLTGCCFGDVCILASGYRFRYPTQAFAVAWEFGTLALLLRLEKKKRVSIFLVWIVLHAVGRIIMETFRGDPRGPDIFGFSISTWISVGLLIVAGILLLRRRNA